MTNNKQPQIDITFRNLARTATLRGSKGKVALILFDDTDVTFTTKHYKNVEEVKADAALYTPRNLSAILDCFIGLPLVITIFRLNAADGLIADALEEIKKVRFDWIGTNSPVISDQTAIVDFVKVQEALKKTYKAVVFAPTGIVDSKQIVEPLNPTVEFDDSRGTQDTFEAIPTIIGYLAGLSLDRSATYLPIRNLKSVAYIDDIDAAIQDGKLVMFNDEGIVKFSTAVTSLVTVDVVGEMMTKIENVETQNLIYNDIYDTFKNDYIGKGKNTVDRQFLFIGSVNTYLKDLSIEELLDPQYNNVSFVDVEKQRAAWKVEKGEEVDEWSDEKVVNTPYKTKLFLAGDIKFLESIENLSFDFDLF